MEPGHEDREYQGVQRVAAGVGDASMEPGHEDREYCLDHCTTTSHLPASMEPGHEDREYGTARVRPDPSTDRLNGARS